MSGDCVLGASLGKCFFFFWPSSTGRWGLTLFLENKSVMQKVSMVSVNDAITLHHLVVTPGVELLICWHWLPLRVAAEGWVHWLASGRALTQCGWAPASMLTLFKGGENVWLQLQNYATHWDPLSNASLLHFRYHFFLSLLVTEALYSPKSIAKILEHEDIATMQFNGLETFRFWKYEKCCGSGNCTHKVVC